MTKEKNPVLSDHFDKLKDLLPEIYDKHFKEEKETRNQKLFRLLKHSLGVIEAVYIQERETFSASKAEEYGKIIEELNALGYDYTANPDLMEKAANFMIMKAKKPMEKAGATKLDEDRKAM